jgi:ParB-like chromosome segregation protein Spo0J
MNVSVPERTHRRAGLLALHLASLDPEAGHARERLEAELGSELTRKLVFALAAHRPVRRAA